MLRIIEWVVTAGGLVVVLIAMGRWSRPRRKLLAFPPESPNHVPQVPAPGV